MHVVFASGASLKALPLLLPDVAEVHLAPTVFPIVLAEAQDAAGELADVDPPPWDAAVVAIHDSGIDSPHPYVSPILLGAESVVPGVLGSADNDGHGTQMAGVAAYSALADGIIGGVLHADAWLVAMRLLESEGDAGGDPERGVMWAERTVESVDFAESLAGQRPVVHNLSIGADNPAREGRTEPHGPLRPTCWPGTAVADGSWWWRAETLTRSLIVMTTPTSTLAHHTFSSRDRHGMSSLSAATASSIY